MDEGRKVRASSALRSSVLGLQGSVALLGAVGAALLAEGPLQLAGEDASSPNYLPHTHHACHALTETLCVAAWWLLFLLVGVARSAEARKQQWAQRMLGVPLWVVAAVQSAAGYYVYTAYTTHDEATFAAVLGVANGSLLLLLASYCLTLVRVPLALQERPYAWNLLAVSAGFWTVLFGLFAYNRMTLLAVLSGASVVLLWGSLWTSRISLHDKAL